MESGERGGVEKKAAKDRRVLRQRLCASVAAILLSFLNILIHSFNMNRARNMVAEV